VFAVLTFVPVAFFDELSFLSEVGALAGLLLTGLGVLLLLLSELLGRD